MREVSVRDAVGIARSIQGETGRETDPFDVFQIIRLIQSGHGSDANKIYGSETMADVVSEMPAELIPPADVAVPDPPRESLLIVVNEGDQS